MLNFDRVSFDLTDQQTLKLLEAIGDGNDWPRFTDDPIINCAVDHLTSNGECPKWSQLDENTRVIYRKEVELITVL